jgi:plasmid stabilization system protein ParE
VDAFSGSGSGKYLQVSAKLFSSLHEANVLRLYEGIRDLKNTPYLGRPGREEGTRELVFAPLPYIAVYRIKDQFIEVLGIYHGAQSRS